MGLHKVYNPVLHIIFSADGNFEVTLATKATLNYTGRVEWRPPAIYKSSCEIDVGTKKMMIFHITLTSQLFCNVFFILSFLCLAEYFPFDEQTCVMKFGTYTRSTYE